MTSLLLLLPPVLGVLLVLSLVLVRDLRLDGYGRRVPPRPESR